LRRLVYDVGMHRGEDTDFYLRRGFDVVGVEANPDLVQMLLEKFQPELRSGQLTIIGKAINDRPGRAKFLVSSKSVWGTLSRDFADRNATLGASAHEIEVECVRFTDILREFGIPYYLKIDIEGCDSLCLDALGEFSQRPCYLSVESCATSPGCGFRDTLKELQKLRALGYRRFKYVDQTVIPDRNDNLTGEGEPIRHTFPQDSSGPFGKDLAGSWQSYAAAAVTGTLLRGLDDLSGRQGGRLYGSRGLWRLRSLRALLTGHADHWYDLHAALEGN
jgi:FkbM family methyltransferase